MEAIERDWVKVITTCLEEAWHEPEAFLDKQAVRAFVLQAMKEMNVPARVRRWVSGAVFRTAEVQEILHQIRRRQAAKEFTPFRGSTLLSDLPFSVRAYLRLKRGKMSSLFDLLLRLAKKGRRGLLEIHDLGPVVLKEILGELEWVLSQPFDLDERDEAHLAMALVDHLLGGKDLAQFLVEQAFQEPPRGIERFRRLSEAELGRLMTVLSLPAGVKDDYRVAPRWGAVCPTTGEALFVVKEDYGGWQLESFRVVLTKAQLAFVLAKESE